MFSPSHNLLAPERAELILLNLMITYGLNRNFRHTKSDTVNWNSRNNGPDAYFSKRQILALSSDTETRVLNDLDEKIHRMAEIVMADPPMQKLVTGIEEYDYEKSYGVSAKEVAFSYYILSICNHAYVMRQRKVLDDNEWSGRLLWIGNPFQRNATMSQIWKLLEDGGFDADFQKFINSEIIGAKPQ